MKSLKWAIIAIAMPVGLFGQTGKYNATDLNKNKEGYVVKDNYDTLTGYIYVSEPHYMEYSISFSRNSDGKDVSMMRPENLIAYAYKDALGKDILWVSTKYSILNHPPEDSYMGKMEHAFLNTTVYGPISLYSYYNFKEGADQPNSTTQYMQTPEQVVDISGMLLGFAKKMPEHLKANATLAKKVQKKEKGYKMMQINDIVREYNAWYEGKNDDYKFLTQEVPVKVDLDINDEIIFSGDVITFDKYPGLEYWLSEPYKMYSKWDTQKTGDAQFTIAIKMRNKMGKPISKISHVMKSYDTQGNLISHSSSSMGPVYFEPNPGNTWPDGYIGVEGMFYTLKFADAVNFDRLEFEISELVFANPMATNNPEFEDEWMEFDGNEGYKFRLSKPFIYVDDLSGNNRFGIAMEFKNESGKEPRIFNFQVTVYDDQGVYYDEERQFHTSMVSPSIHFMKPGFPVDYQGVAKDFYSNEDTFMDNYKKIEIKLNSVVFN